jgi:hypothetical protein
MTRFVIILLLVAATLAFLAFDAAMIGDLMKWA